MPYKDILILEFKKLQQNIRNDYDNWELIKNFEELNENLFDDDDYLSRKDKLESMRDECYKKIEKQVSLLPNHLFQVNSAAEFYSILLNKNMSNMRLDMVIGFIRDLDECEDEKLILNSIKDYFESIIS